MTEIPDRQSLRRKVIEAIEDNFKGSVVLWCGSGLPDDEYDETEQFEALWITDEDYERFENFVSELEESLAIPNGYTIMVHSLSPEATKKYRLKEYQDSQFRKSLCLLKKWSNVLTLEYTNVFETRIKWDELISSFRKSMVGKDDFMSYFFSTCFQCSVDTLWQILFKDDLFKPLDCNWFNIWENLSTRSNANDYFSEIDEESKELITYSLAA